MAAKSLSSFRRLILASPPAEYCLNALREALIGAIRCGRVPKHIAFVMDGNRRYARTRRIETVEGHNLGFEALARILEVCYKSGVTHVTIYAFSIENFKRSKYEVDALMDMAKVKLTQLSQHGELLDRYGAKIRILGQRSLIKPDVLEAMDRAVNMTSHNDKTVLNICFPYTSRDEITTAIRTTVEDWSLPISSNGPNKQRRTSFNEERIRKTVRWQRSRDDLQDRSGRETRLQDEGVHNPSTPVPNMIEEDMAELETASTSSTASLHHASLASPTVSASTVTSYTSSPISKPTSQPQSPSYEPLKSIIRDDLTPSVFQPVDSITAETLTQHMFTAHDPPLDLLIRTSGVERLSDFMLWQCHENTRIVFLDVLWPEFDLWSFLPVLWEWQWRERKEEQLSKELRSGQMKLA